MITLCHRRSDQKGISNRLISGRRDREYIAMYSTVSTESPSLFELLTSYVSILYIFPPNKTYVINYTSIENTDMICTLVFLQCNVSFIKAYMKIITPVAFRYSLVWSLLVCENRRHNTQWYISTWQWLIDLLPPRGSHGDPYSYLV